MRYIARVKQAPPLLICSAILLLSISSANAQYENAPQSFLDGKPVPRPSVRDNDLVWMTTVWRRIDLRQKMNQPLYFPESPAQGRASLYDLLVKGLLEEQQFRAYDVGALGQNDMFTDPLSREELLALIRKTDTVQTVSPFTNEFIYEEVPNYVETEDIIAFDIKERWFIDAQQSVMKVGVIGIAPVAVVKDEETGDFRGTKRLFWIDYNEARYAMATWPVYIGHNDVQYISYDNLFHQRRFDGTITKVSNVYDRSIIEYLEPEDALYQALMEHEKIREQELDMWNY